MARLKKGERHYGPVVTHVYNGGFIKDRVTNQPLNVKSRAYREVPVMTWEQEWIDDDIIGRRRAKASSNKK